MRNPRLRLPAMLLGLVFSAICCAFTPYNNIKLQNSPLAGGHFPLASFGCLLLLVAVVNPIVSLVRKSWRLRFHELLLIWSMVTVSTGIAYTGLMRTFIINITTPQWFTTTTSDLSRVLLPILPGSIFPKDPGIIRPLYSGLEGGLDMSWWQIISRIPWSVWILPLLWWGLFIFLVYLAMVGLVGLFSHQWIENEKMNFPLLRVPEILSEESEKDLLGFFTHGYFIIGFCIPLFLHTFNGLHTYFPEVPQIPTLILAQPYIPRQGLLSGFYKMKIYIYPAFIGFAFLASKQISFSLWIFFILGGLLPGVLQVLGWRLPAAAIGTTFSPGLSKVEEMQMIGAFAVFFFFIVWLARDYLKQVVWSFFTGRTAGLESTHGFLSPRIAFVTFFAGFIGTTLWLVFMGMDVLSTLLFLLVCFMIQLVASRLICQGGLPYFTLAAAPTDGFLTFIDTRLIAPATLYLGAIVQKVTFLDLREALMPSLFHSSKFSDGSRPRNRFLWGIVWAMAVGLVVSFVAMIALYYKFGIGSLPDDWALETTRRVHENVAQLLTHPERPKQWSVFFAIVGAFVMALLIMGYHLFIWWPLHPIGYLTTYSSAMQILWFGFFVGWLCNTLVLRYGGANRFNEARRLFIGMIVGDFVMAIIWLIVGIFAPISYHALPL